MRIMHFFFGLLMVYEDELQQQAAKQEAEESDGEDWGSVARDAASSSGTSYRGRGGYRGRGRKTYRGGVRKKTKRKAGARKSFGSPSSAKKKSARGASTSATRGSKLGSMPMPKPNLAALNAQLLKAKSLKF